MSEDSEAIDKLVENIGKVVDVEIAKWDAAGVDQADQRARLLTVVSHSAGMILGMCASVDRKPRDFIRAALPDLAEQMEAQARDAVDALVGHGLHHGRHH